MLCRELELRRGEIGDKLMTIYFGGGTPSQLPPKLIATLFRKTETLFDLSSLEEVTFEANPDDLTPDYITQLRQLPINRLSIGAQSFDNNDLKTLGRRHNAEQARRAVSNCFDAGFSNITIDLMYGLPNQGIEKWDENLKETFALPISHLSAYHLTYEEGTYLHQQLMKGECSEPDESVSEEMFHLLRKRAADAGFVHYEISNFSLPNREAVHNSGYWSGRYYLGIGASAHSYNGQTRSWNMADVGKYIEQIRKGMLPLEREILSQHDKFNDYILTRLRTAQGISLSETEKEFGFNRVDHLLKQSHRFLLSSDLVTTDGTIRLTPKGMLRSDGIMVELMEG